MLCFFIPLDIFKESLRNKGIQNRLDGWLTFLSSDAPEDICALLDRYPDFRDLYEHVYQICRNMENIMGIFSEELAERDKALANALAEKERELSEMKARIRELEAR